MSEIGKYLLKIVAVAMICSIACAIGAKGRFSASIRMLSGLIIIISIVRPVLPLQLKDFSFDLESITQNGNDIIEQGSAAAESFASQIISEKINAYIETKAQALGADVRVDTILSGGMPAEIMLSGQALPYIRSQLLTWIESEIGVERKAVHWR